MEGDFKPDFQTSKPPETFDLRPDLLSSAVHSPKCLVQSLLINSNCPLSAHPPVFPPLSFLTLSFFFFRCFPSISSVLGPHTFYQTLISSCFSLLEFSSALLFPPFVLPVVSSPNPPLVRSSVQLRGHPSRQPGLGADSGDEMLEWSDVSCLKLCECVRSTNLSSGSH